MEFDELLITTGVDALVRLVREKERIELKVAAGLLNIPEATIEDWMHVLEEEGIVKIEYYLTRVYLSWVAPTEEKIKMEKEVFYQEKSSIEKEIEGLKSRIEPDLASLNELKQSFSKFYATFAPRLEKLEKELEAMSVPADFTFFEAQKAAVSVMGERLIGLEDSLKSLKNELGNIRLEITTSTDAKKSSEKLDEEVSSIHKALEGISRKAAAYQKGVPPEMPAISEIKKKFDSIRKDFDAIKNTNMLVRDDLTGIRESSGVLGEVEASIKKYEAKMADTKEELASLAGTAEQIKSVGISLSDKIKKDAELLEHFADSIDVAKGILQRFPSQQDVEKELDRIKKVEVSIQEKINNISRLLGSLPSIKSLSDEFAQVRKKADDKKTELEAKSEEIKSSLEESAETYSTFEKIKEKTLVSIQGYNAQLQALADEITRLKKANQGAAVNLEQFVKNYQEKVRRPDVSETIKAAEDIRNKKLLMDQLTASFDSISETAENVSKRLNLLAKEANLLELRAGGAVTAEQIEKEKGVAQQIRLTRQEEDDFNKKREELKDLIKKLWEQG